MVVVVGRRGDAGRWWAAAAAAVAVCLPER